MVSTRRAWLGLDNVHLVESCLAGMPTGKVPRCRVYVPAGGQKGQHA